MQPDQPCRPVFAASHRQGLQVGVLGDAQGGDDRGQGVAVDEFQDQEAGLGGAHPAQHCPNPCARFSTRAAKSAAAWPDTSRTASRCRGTGW